MADVYEDVITCSDQFGGEVDLSDETQDFRFLASISREDAKIPKRGEKDFEPHATALQSNTLAASRQAMHSALAFQRVHQPKGYTVATYHPETNMAYSLSPKGPLFSRMGHIRSVKDDPFGGDNLRGQRLWLLPEEVIYLIERGTIDVRWPSSEDDAEYSGLSMSLQAAYAMFIGDEVAHQGALTIERYSVYSGLKRSGYTVQRAPSWDNAGPAPTLETYPPSRPPSWRVGLSSVTSMWTRMFADDHGGNRGPLIRPASYKSYPDIFRRLSLVDHYDPTSQQAPREPSSPSTDPGFRVTYHVWKPGSSAFKKSAPGPPDFRIAVINARESSVPTLQQLSALMETVPYDPPKSDAQLYQKLRHGYKNVILAVVDQGVVSYLRVADAAFGLQKLFERKVKGPGSKRGGRAGGRGRGR